MSSVALHVIRRFVEVSDSGNMIFPGLAHNLPWIGDENTGVPIDPLVVSLVDGIDDDHVILLSQLGQKGSALALQVCTLGELVPRIALSRAEEERRTPRLLQANNVHIGVISRMHHPLYLFHQ